MTGVAEIVRDVRARGDAAVREWAVRLDGVEPGLARATEAVPEQALAGPAPPAPP